MVEAQTGPPGLPGAGASAPAGGARVELAPGVSVPESALRFQYARSSGPGGQNVNKVNTKAEAWVPLAALAGGGLSERAAGRLVMLAGRRLTEAGEIHIASDTHRTQRANRQAVLDRLRELLLEALHEPKARRKRKPSRAAKQRRLESKRHRSDIKGNRRAGGSGD
jgi:ribosome-associated protein